MWYIFNKQNELVFEGNKSKDRSLKPQQVYYNFDALNQKAIWYEPKQLPEYFDVIDKIIVEWDLQKQFDEGVFDPGVGQTVENNIIRAKTDAERVSSGEITQAELDAEILAADKQKALSDIMAMDAELPRALEDLIDTLDDAGRIVNLPDATRARGTEKKRLRKIYTDLL